ncbi:MAG: hypothetical protein ACRDFW_03555, partial [bacterium]
MSTPSMTRQALQSAEGAVENLPEAPPGVSLVGEVNVLLRHISLMIVLPVVAAVAAVGLSLVRGRAYVAESRFTPQAEGDNLERVAGLAAQFGISLGGSGTPNQSVEFYGELLRSRELLKAAVLSNYAFPTRPGLADTVRGTLLDIYHVRGTPPESRLQDAINQLQDQVVANTGLRRAGIVTLTTTAPWPDLAVQVNRRLLELINDFNLRQRQSQAAAERRFVEERLAQIRTESQAAESALAQFLERNRQYQSSPRLVFEAARLQRNVDLVQQVYATLAKAYEEARIQEVRNTPLITILDNPE